MKKFEEWADHYGYQDTPEARADYARYVHELRHLGAMTAAREGLDKAAEHIEEMRDILTNGDSIQSLTAVYSDALDSLTQALQYGIEASI